MKAFKACFKVTYCGNLLSYSARNMALRVGNTEVEITEDDLSDLENCSRHDIAIPLRIFGRIRAAN